MRGSSVHVHTRNPCVHVRERSHVFFAHVNTYSTLLYSLLCPANAVLGCVVLFHASMGSAYPRLGYTVLCYAVLYCAILCYANICYAILCYAILIVLS